MEEVEFKTLSGDAGRSLTLRRVPAVPEAIDDRTRYVFTLDGREYRSWFSNAAITAYQDELCLEFCHPKVQVYGHKAEEPPHCCVVVYRDPEDVDGEMVWCAPEDFEKVLRLVEQDYPSVIRVLPK